MPQPQRDRPLTLLLVVLPALVIALHPLANNDLPLHLAIGEWILDHGTLPATDPFSFTAGGRPWVPHEWLAGVIFALAERAGGSVALVLLAGLGAACVALVHRLACSQLGVSATAHLLWAVPLWLLAGRRLMLRPHLIALALPFLVWWLLLAGRSRPRLLWWLVPTLVAWVNVHGSFLLGFAIVVLDLAVCGRGHPVPLRTRLLVTAAALATVLTQVHVYFQPGLLAGVQHAVGLVRDPVFMETVREWIAPLDSPDYRRTVAFALSGPWLVIAAWGAVRSRRHGTARPLSYDLFVLATLFLYLRHQRFVALFALASLPLMPLPRLAPTSRVPLLSRATVLVAALLLFYPGFPVTFRDAPRRPGFHWAWNLPFAAVDALRAWDISGGVLCEYDYGGVIAWRGEGRLRPTMDSRNSVYGAAAFIAHQQALGADTALRRRLLDEVSAVIIRSARGDLIAGLLADPRWLRIHVSPTAQAFIRR